MGPRRQSTADVWLLYSSRLTDEYSFLYSSVFLLLSVLAASRTESLQNKQTIQELYSTNITHIIKSTTWFTTSKRKTSLTTLRQYSSRQAKPKPNIWQAKANNDYGTASLPSDRPVGLKRVSTKSYPCPPPFCDSEPP
jgi:hypothetical protein